MNSCEGFYKAKKVYLWVAYYFLDSVFVHCATVLIWELDKYFLIDLVNHVTWAGVMLTGEIFPDYPKEVR